MILNPVDSTDTSKDNSVGHEESNSLNQSPEDLSQELYEVSDTTDKSKSIQQEQPVSVAQNKGISKSKQTHKVSWSILYMLIALIVSLSLLSVGILYKSAPSSLDKTEMALLEYYQSLVKTGDLNKVGSFINKRGFLSQEYTYSNAVKNNKDIISLKSKLLKSVDYTYSKDKGSGKFNYNKEYSPKLTSGTPIVRTYFDWSTVKIDEDALRKDIQKQGISKDNPDYALRISLLFANYLNRKINVSDTKSTLISSSYLFTTGDSGDVSISLAEDKYLDQALFSNTIITSLFNDFQSKAWKILGQDGVMPTGRWLVPDIIYMGAYNLSNAKLGTAVVATPDSGHSLKTPAGIGNQVQTVYPDDKGHDQPISVTLVKYMIGYDAIKWYESKDTRNTGYDPTSKLTQVGYVFNVVNLSTVPLAISDNSCLVDNMGNPVVRVGSLFGMKDSATLQPGESTQIESWSDSVDIDRLYLVWGKTYIGSQKDKIVYFRVLGAEDGNNQRPVTDSTPKK